MDVNYEGYMDNAVSDSPFGIVLGNPSRTKVLFFLLLHPLHDYTTAELSEYCDLCRQSVRPALDTLMDYGLVTRTQKVGATQYYRYDLKSKPGRLLIDFNLAIVDYSLKN